MVEKPIQWVRYLPWAKYWFNTTYNYSMRMTPFKALHGQDLPTFFKLKDIPSCVEEVNEKIQMRNVIILELKPLDNDTRENEVIC